MTEIGKQRKRKQRKRKNTHIDRDLYFKIHTSNGTTYTQVRDCKKQSFSIFENILSLKILNSIFFH